MKKILTCFCLCVFLVACAPNALPLTPTIQVSPTETLIPIPTATAIPNTLKQEVEVTSLPTIPSGLPPEIQSQWSAEWTVNVENGVQILYNPDGVATATSKDGVNWERVFQIENFSYTNNAGETIEIPSSSDPMAIVKLLADNAQWFPAGQDVREVFLAMDSDNLHQYVQKNFDIGWPPAREVRPWGGTFPRAINDTPDDTPQTAYMAVFCFGLQEGTIVIVQSNTPGEYYTVYYAGDIDEFKADSFLHADSPVYQYIEELAAEH